MSFVVLRYTGHPASFRNSVEMLKRWNPECTVQHRAEGVALVLGVGSIEQLKGLTEDWTLDPKIAAQLSHKPDLDTDESNSSSP